MIFCLRKLQEKTREQQMPLHGPLWISLKLLTTWIEKCSSLFSKKLDVLQSYLILSNHSTKACNALHTMISEPFPFVNGVKQGCVLAPTLFGIYFSVILREVKQNANPGVGLRTRFDANLFSTSHLTKTRTLPSALIPRNNCDSQRLASKSVSKRLSSWATWLK